MYTRRGLNTIQCVSIAAQVSWLLNILHSVEARLDSVRGQGRAKCFKTAVYSKTFHRLNLQSKAYYCRDFPLKHKTRQHSAIHGMQSSRSWDDTSHTTSKVSKQIFQILRILKKQTKTLQYHEQSHKCSLNIDKSRDVWLNCNSWLISVE